MKNMKNLLILLISFTALSLASCQDDHYYDDMSNPHNNNQGGNGGGGGYVGVTVSLGTGGPGVGAPAVQLPQAGAGWVKLPINIVAPELFYSYQVAPYSFYPITIWVSDTQFITGCVTAQTRSTINTLAFSQGYQQGDWIQITHLMLNTEVGSAPQVIEFIQ
jgi:hypothetical protein